MSEELAPVITVGTATVAPEQMPGGVMQAAAPAVQMAAPTGGVPASAPAAPAEPAGVEGAPAGLDGMTDEQLTALVSRIEETRASRPPSIVQQLEELKGQLPQLHTEKQAAVTAKKEEASRADALEDQIGQVLTGLRRAEIVEAATAAGFAAPKVVADSLVAQEGDPVELVQTAAASGAWAINKPAPSAPIGGPATKVPQGMDPGRAAMIEEIRRATGR